MDWRGASSGISDRGNKYGAQYKPLLQDGNIKFIQMNSRDSETLMGTKSSVRVYVQVGGGENLISITYFDKKSKRSEQIDLNHMHLGLSPHSHGGYCHNENGTSKLGANRLSTDEKNMVDRVTRIWNTKGSK